MEKATRNYNGHGHIQSDVRTIPTTYSFDQEINSRLVVPSKTKGKRGKVVALSSTLHADGVYEVRVENEEGRAVNRHSGNVYEEQTNKLVELRDNALASFWDSIERQNCAPQSVIGDTISRETADSYTPGHFEVMAELALETFENTPRYLMSYSIDTSVLPTDCNSYDLLKAVIYDFILDQITVDITRRLLEEEQEKDDEEQEEEGEE